MLRPIYCLVPIFFSGLATAGTPLICGQESGTNKVFCVDPKALVKNGDLRGSALYSGGPKNIQKTNMTIIVNCQSQVTVLQDASGVNVGGGRFGHQTAHMDSLFTQICAQDPKKIDKNIRQF